MKINNEEFKLRLTVGDIIAFEKEQGIAIAEFLTPFELESDGKVGKLKQPDTQKVLGLLKHALKGTFEKGVDNAQLNDIFGKVIEEHGGFFTGQSYIYNELRRCTDFLGQRV